MKPSTRKTFIWVAVTLGVLLAGLILYLYNPLTAGFYPRCPSKLLTGYDCPGCGSLRAIHSIMHGDMSAAWHYNPAVFFGMVLLGLIAFAAIHRREAVARRMPSVIIRWSRRAARITDSTLFPAILFVAVILWAVLRNIN